jgi:Fe2+ or Zn2+ uptake regulation protein
MRDGYVTNCSECREIESCYFLPHADGGGRWICDECKSDIHAHICAACNREADIDLDTSEEAMMPICYECAEEE